MFALKIKDPLQVFIAFVLTVIAMITVVTYLQNSQYYSVVVNGSSFLAQVAGGASILGTNGDCNVSGARPVRMDSIRGAQTAINNCLNNNRRTCGMQGGNFSPATNDRCLNSLQTVLRNGGFQSFTDNRNPACNWQCDRIVPPVVPPAVVGGGKCSTNLRGSYTCNANNLGVDCRDAGDCVATCDAARRCVQGGIGSRGLVCTSDADCVIRPSPVSN